MMTTQVFHEQDWSRMWMHVVNSVAGTITSQGGAVAPIGMAIEDAVGAHYVRCANCCSIMYLNAGGTYTTAILRGEPCRETGRPCRVTDPASTRGVSE